jgi:hypothetical protein
VEKAKLLGPILTDVKNKRTLGKIYAGLGIVFATIGAIMVVLAATTWHTNQLLVWPVIIYAILNLLISYGFFTRAKWLFPAFAATIAGLATLFVLFSSYYGIDAVGMSSLIKLAVVGAILWYLYQTRRHLRSSPHDAYVGGLFIFLLLGTMSYSALLALS